MDAFGIFEGGGAKGLAHIGALKSAEERKIRFVGVAGSSAGAIVASMVAAGYTASELFDPDNANSGAILNADLTTLLNPKIWRSVKPIKDLLKSEGLDFFASKQKLFWRVADPRKYPLNWHIFC